MNRQENIERLKTEQFDLCIIGAGASGAGSALDAALRGLKVALVDRDDFAAGTSSRSTKLAHGGVRYLEQAIMKMDWAQLRQVRHGLKERRLLIDNAPHLAAPLGLITPVFSWWEGLYFSIGLKLYDFFCPLKLKLPKSVWLNKKETLARMPGISPGIHSAVLYFDGQFDDARYCLALVQSAASAGAVVVNYMEVIDFQKDPSGKIDGLVLQDNAAGGRGTSFTLHARCVLNCCGPFSDHIRLKANPALNPRIRPSKGVHLVLPATLLNSKHAMLIPKTKDGRVVFAVPFENALLLGTTDDPYEDLLAEPKLTSEEVAYLLETIQEFVGEKINPGEVKSGFGGIRPLLVAANHPAKETKTLLRDHELEVDAHSGLVSLLGGKWTTYRLMAKDAVDKICERLSIRAACRTSTHKLFGAPEDSSHTVFKNLQHKYPLDAEVLQHLAQKYGVQAHFICARTSQQPALATRLLPQYPIILAEVAHAVEMEMAVTIRDFLARRTRLESVDWEAAKEASPIVGRLMAEHLGWSEETENAQIKAYNDLISNFQTSIKF